MKTDSLINRLLGEFLEAFFALIGEDERQAERYEFTSIEVKDQAFRFDGVVQSAAPEDKLYFFESQFQPEDKFYLRFFGEAAVYLHQKNPQNAWRAVVLFPNKAADPGVHPHYEELFESGRLRRVYLTDLPPELLEKFPLNLLRIIIEPEEKVIATAEEIVRQLPEQISDEQTREAFVDLLINLLLNKLTNMSRQEIEKMVEPLHSNVKKSRFYQEVAEEVAQELTPKIAQESKYGIARTMLKKNFDLELIAEITGLSQEEIRALSWQMTDGTN